MEDFETYYEVLEVEESATIEQIRSSFRKLAKQYHPDEIFHLPERLTKLRQDAEEKFRKINEAWGVLQDAVKKSQYDEKLRLLRELQRDDSYEASAAAPPPPHRSPAAPSQPPPPPVQPARNWAAASASPAPKVASFRSSGYRGWIAVGIIVSVLFGLPPIVKLLVPASIFPLQAGVVSACGGVRGWRNFTAKNEFKLNEAICAYAEALGVNKASHVNVTYTFTLVGPDRKAYTTRTVECLVANTTATACEQNVLDLRLPANAPVGSYTLQVSMRDNLTGRSGNGSAQFTVVQPGAESHAPTSSTPTIAGLWLGTFGDSSGTTAFEVDLKETGAQFRGTCHDLQPGNSEVLSDFSGLFERNSVQFKKHYLPNGSEVSYTGVVSSDGQSMSGTWALGSREGQWRMSRQPQTVQNPSIELAPPNADPATPQGMLTIGTSQGNVLVRNFLRDGSYIAVENEAVVLSENLLYRIVYNRSDQSFVVSLLSKPLSSSRAAAEAAFLSALNVTEKDACKLKVSEGIPTGVDEAFRGENFSLSFCNGGETHGLDSPGIPSPGPPLAVLDVQAAPGTEVSVDGLSRGATNQGGFLAIHDLTPGSHVITAVKAGYANFLVTIQLESGKTTSLPIQLKWEGGYLSFHVNPAGTSVYVVGLGQFSGDSKDNLCPVGTYTLTASHMGMKTEKRILNVRAGQHWKVEFNLLPDPAFSGDKK